MRLKLVGRRLVADATELPAEVERDERALLARYAAIALAVVGGLEWLLGRVVSRIGAAPPLEGTPRDIVEALGRTGIFMSAPAFILAACLYYLSILNLGTRCRHRNRAGVALAIYLATFGAFALVHSFLPTLTWVNVSFNLLSLVAVWWVALASFGRRDASLPAGSAVLLVALAWTGWYYYVLQPTLTNVGGSVLVLNLGELVAVCSTFALFWAIAVPGGEWRNVRRWIAPMLLALAFSVGNIADMMADQGFAGVFAIWSVGFNLFLPWPVYAVALALFVYSLLTCFARAEGKAAFANANTGVGLLLILFAGYNLQLAYQHLLAVLSLMLISSIARPMSMLLGSMSNSLASALWENGRRQ